MKARSDRFLSRRHPASLPAKKRREVSHQRRLFLEPLEDRRLLAVSSWITAGSGDWSDGANWSGGIIPDGVGDEAIFPDVGGAISVNVDSPRTVGKLTITNPANVSISGSQLTMDAASGDAEVSFQSNDVHGLAAPLLLQDPLRFTGTGINAGVSSDISGAFGIRKVDGGRVRLSGNSSFTGPSFVDTGSFWVEHANALGSPSSGTTINAGGTVEFFSSSSTSLIVPEPFTLNGGTLNGGAFNFHSLTRASGAINVTGPSEIRLAESDAGTFELTGPMSGSGSLTIDNDPFGAPGAVLSLAGSNTMTGPTTIGNSFDVTPDVVRVDSTGALSASSVYTVHEVLDLNGNNASVKGLVGDGEIQLGGATLTIADPTSQSFSGTISESGNVVKMGTGTQTLLGTNTYSGTTSIQNGTLRVDGTIGAGGPADTVSISSGATLSGGGDVNAPISGAGGSTIDAAGNLSLGTSGSTSGFSTSGSLNVGGFSVTLRDANAAVLGSSTNLAGGVLLAANGVSMSSGDVLTGNGTVNAALDVNSATVSPGLGSGAATLTTGNTSFSTGSLNIDVIDDGTPGVDYDQLDVDGTLDLGTANLNLSGSFVPVSGTELTIIDNDGIGDAVSGTFAGFPEDAVTIFNGQPLQISYQGGDGNDVTLSFTADPIFDLGGADNDILVQLSGGNVELIVDGNPLLSASPAVINSLTINGQGGDDTLTVDFSGGDPVPSGGIEFNGGTNVSTNPGDELVLTGGTATDVIYTFDNENDGSVDIDGSTITYTGLEPVTDNLNATNREFTFTSNMAETITLDASGSLDNRIDSTQGELVDFTNPTSTLTINVEAMGGSGADMVNVEGLDAAFNADLSVNAGNDDTVTFQTNPTDTVSGDVSIAAMTINVDAAVSTSGAITLDASRNVLVSSSGSLSTVDGGIILSGNASGTATGDFIGVVVDGGTVSTTGDGNVLLEGQGGTSGFARAGVQLVNGAVLESTSASATAGTITLTGQGGSVPPGPTVGNNYGILLGELLGLTDPTTGIMSVNGDITLTGTGGSGGMANIGVNVSQIDRIESTGTGPNAASILIDGSGQGSNAVGVNLFGPPTKILTVDGDILVEGTGGFGGSNSHGVSVNRIHEIRSTGTGPDAGTITLVGTSSGGPSSTFSDGVRVTSLAIDPTVIASIDGNILLDGTGQGSSIGSGVLLQTSGGPAIQTTGDAAVTVSGSATSSNTGVQIFSGIDGHDGLIQVESDNDDVRLLGTGTITSNAGPIEIMASANVELINSFLVQSAAGDITVTADTAPGANGGAISMADGTRIDADSGWIDLDADGDITLGGVSGDEARITTTGGAILDGGDSLIDIDATTTALRAVGGIGSGDALETDLLMLAASNTSIGNIEISDVGANANLLTIGTVDSLVGVTNTAPGGTVVVTNASPLTVAANVSSAGSVTLTAGDSAAAGDDLTVNAGVTVESTGADITLNAGDDAHIDGNLSAPSGILTINVDPSAGDPDAVGGTLDIDAASVVTTGGGAFLVGGDDNDTFNFAPRSTTTFDVDGNPPVFGDAGVPPGDTLNLDLTGFAPGSAVLTLGMNPGDGNFQFLAPQTELPVTFTSIETVTEVSGGPYHLVLDMRLAGFEDGMDDLIEAHLDATGTDLLVDVNSAQWFQGPVADILSFTVIGSDDDDTLRIEETAGGLPQFIGQAPPIDNTGIGGGVSSGSHLNASAKFQMDADYSSGPFTAADVSIHFDGSDGTDGAEVILITTHDAAYFSDTSDAANSGNLYTAAGAVAPDLLLSFANLDPLSFTGAGGSLLVDATSTPATDRLTISDDGAPMDGTSIIAGNGGFEDTSFSGFGTLTVRGGTGGEAIDLVALDNATTTTTVTLDGDNTTDDDAGNDTLQVRSTPPGVAVTLLGGLGDDNFWIFSEDTGGDAANTVDNIQGTVDVSPAGTDNVPAGGDTDSLLVVDRADVTGGGDVISIDSLTIDGIFDSGSGTDVSYDPNQLDHVTLVGSGEGDTLSVDFMGSGGSDLDSVTINGSGGSDLFLLLSDTAPGVTTTLNGDENVMGAPNTGANDDLLDLAALASPRTVFLTGHGSIDGYRGTEAAIQGPGSGFTNIDAVHAPAGGSDTLVMDIATDRTHWDLGGMVSGFGPFGVPSFTLTDSPSDTGVLISDESDLSLGGNATQIGRAENDPLFAPDPPQPNPIAPNAAGEDDLAWSGFEHLTGAMSADDRFDLRDGASITGTIDGRGSDVNGDSIDLRDYTTPVAIDLAAGTSTGVGGGLTTGSGGPLDGSSIENAFGGFSRDQIIGDQDNNILGDGPDSDSLDGGAVDVMGDIISGNDTFQLEPGALDDGTGDSSDTLTDLNGNDTLNFRFADSNVMVDMDLLDMPQDVLFTTPGLQNVTLMRRAEHDPLGPSMFENVVGSQYNDVIDLDSLTLDGNSPQGGPPTLRNVDGNDPFIDGPDDGNPPDPAEPIPPGDEWHFDAFGQPAIDTGFSVSAPGQGTVTYQSIETFKPFNTRPRIIDDGDDDYSEIVTSARGNISFFANWNQVAVDGYQGDFRFNHADTQSGEDGGDSVAEWSFFGVTPGMYRVSVSFPSPAVSPQLVDVASDAEYSILDDGRIIARRDIDQRTGADDFLDDGTLWENLGVFDIRSHTLQIQLRDRADGIVQADAVRIERVNVIPEGAGSLVSPSTGGELTVLQGNQAILDGTSQVDMVTNITDPLIRTFVIRNDGDGPLRIDDILLDPPDVSGPNLDNYTLVKPTGLSPMAPISIAPGDSIFFTLTLDAETDNEQGDFPAQIRIFSNDYDENIIQKPGTTGIVDPTDTVNTPPNDVDPFTIDIRGVVTDDWIIDDGDPEFQVVGVWQPPSGAAGYLGDDRTTAGDDSGDRAIWTFNGLPDGVYRVSATWTPQQGNLVASTQSPFRVLDSGGIISTVSVDQTVAPDDFADEGAMWEDISGPVALTGGFLRVNLRDAAGQPSRQVIADAIRIERLYSDASTTPPHVTTFPDIRVEVDAAEVVDDTGVVDFGETYPGTPITKTFTIENVGGADLVVDQPIAVPPGYKVIEFDGVTSPDGVTSATIMPGNSTTMTVRMIAGLPGELSGEVALETNDPDEDTFNFDVTGTIRSSKWIDNQGGAPGFTHTAGFQLFTNNDQGFRGRVHFASGDSSGDTATWTFDGVTPGRQYLVSVSWTADPNRASDAPYSVSGVTAPATIDVNQRLDPSDRKANGHVFGDLGIFTADMSGTLTVTLTDDANGVVIADVARIAPVEQPEIEVVQASNVLLDGEDTVDFGSAPVGSPVDRTLTINNVGSRPLQLGPPQLPPGFSLPGGFPGSIPAGGSDSFTVRFNGPAPGEFGGVLRFASDELDENPFEIALNADAFTVGTQIIDDGGAGFSSTAPFSTMGGGFLGDYQQAPVAASPPPTGTATWTFAVAPMTQYRVSATWVAAANRATNATYSLGGVMSGLTSSAQNQRVAPNDFNDAGTAWEDLAIVTTDGSGTLTVSLPNDTAGLDGLVIADAVRIEPLWMINNEDPAPHYSETGGQFFTFGGQGRRGTMEAAANNAPASTAVFTFANLTPGSTYRVSATWPESLNRATDAPFTVSGVVGGPNTVEINQELAPDDYTAQGSSWEDLGGPYTVDGSGMITVTLTNIGADEYVVADAIRLQPLPAQPEIFLADSGMNDVPDGGTFTFTPTAVGTPVTETFTISNHGSAPLLLDGGSLAAALDQVPQFELVSGFSVNPVPPAGTSTFTVRMLADEPGSPTATIPFGNNDADENPYEITLTGDVVIPSAIIDDGDAGYVESGPNLPLATFGGQGFQNDVRQIAPGSGNAAGYTFTGLTPGSTYQIAATWTGDANRSSQAPLTVLGALGGNVEFAVNQQVAPSDFTEGGKQFDVIGRFRTTGTSLTVEWGAAASGFVIADAVQVVEVLAPGPEIQVTGSPNVADGGTFNLGVAAQGSMLSKTFTITNQGGSPLSIAGGIQLPAGFTLGAVAPAGLFGGGPTVIPADGAAATFEILVDTSTDGIKSGTLAFGSNDADENPFEIQLSAEVVSATTIIDDGDAGFSGPGFGVFGSQGFMNDVRQSAANAGNTATWTFTGLDPAGIYQVAATWTAFSNRATNAPYTVTGSSMATINVNQKVPPAGFSDAGVNWQTLNGSFAPDGGNTITVTLTDVGADGNVIADAVRLERLFGPEIEVTQDTAPVIDGVTTVDFGQALIGSTFSRTFTIENAGAAGLELAPNLNLPAGFTLVTAGPDAPTPATLFDGSMTDTVLAPGATATFTVEVDTTSAASFSGSLSFGTNDANEAPFNFSIEAEVVASLIIDDGDASPGYADTANMMVWPQGFQGDVREAVAGGAAQGATYTFDGLPTGTYRVSATWTAYSNRASNAAYVINGGSPIPVNQKLAPNNPLATGLGTFVTDSGGNFADLSITVSPVGGTITVDISDAGANGNVIIDAIRLERLGPLRGEFDPAIESDTAIIAPLTSSEIQPLLDRAIGYWAVVDDSAAAWLRDVQVGVTELPGTILGLGSFTSPTIWLDDDGAGYGWNTVGQRGRDGGIDLLTVITHELGHVLGYPDLDPLDHPGHIMGGRLAVGESRVASSVLDHGLPSVGSVLSAPSSQYAAADLGLGLLEWESRGPLSSELASSEPADREEVAAGPATRVDRALDALQPLLDWRDRRPEYLGEETSLDDFFTELGDEDNDAHTV